VLVHRRRPVSLRRRHRDGLALGAMEGLAPDDCVGRGTGKKNGMPPKDIKAVSGATHQRRVFAHVLRPLACGHEVAAPIALLHPTAAAAAAAPHAHRSPIAPHCSRRHRPPPTQRHHPGRAPRSRREPSGCSRCPSHHATRCSHGRSTHPRPRHPSSRPHAAPCTPPAAAPVKGSSLIAHCGWAVLLALRCRAVRWRSRVDPSISGLQCPCQPWHSGVASCRSPGGIQTLTRSGAH